MGISRLGERMYVAEGCIAKLMDDLDCMMMFQKNMVYTRMILVN